MRLLTAHKILIGAALALAVLLALRSFAIYGSGHGKAELLRGIGEAALAVALGVYLRALSRR